ncbi:MAG TPA: hypothetical protein VLE94_09315 [Burkholderiaceae bacterium]|nr:hypothetical protein [Burkholderiaceae bacterium]
MSTTTNPTSVPPLPVWPQVTPARVDQMHDEAKARAVALREQAIAELWGGAGALWGDAVDQTRRAADRLAARLHQHAKRRAEGSCALGA